MKALYMKGTVRLTEAEREQYQGYRFENADVFERVAGGIKSAVVAGDYPNVEAALKDAEIEFEKVELEDDGVPEVTAKSAPKGDDASDKIYSQAEADALIKTAVDEAVGKAKEAAEAEKQTAIKEAVDAAIDELSDNEETAKAQAKDGTEEETGDLLGNAEPLFDVYKVVDGKQATRASKHNINKADADAFVAANPENEYNIVPDEPKS